MKILLLSALKLGLVGSIGAVLFLEAGALALGLPGGWVLISLLLNVFGLGWACHAFLSSLVGGMVMPDEKSSRAYIQFYNSSHLLLHRAPNTKDLWEMLNRAKAE